MAVKNNKITSISVHVCIWALIMVSPLIFSLWGGKSVNTDDYLRFLISPICFMTVFYLNYFLLVDRFLFKKRFLGFAIYNIVLIAFLLFAQHYLNEFFNSLRADNVGELLRQREHPGPPRLFFIMWNALLFAFTTGLSVAIKMTANVYRVEAEKTEIEKERTQAELANLRNQLNPHFLFNTLNNIYALVSINPQQAQYAIHSLSGLLRHVLYENERALVPLDDELEFVKSYVELMMLRLQKDKVDIRLSFPESMEGVSVAPLLFIPLIENAFKHGISPTGHSFVHAAFSIDRSAGKLSCTIENSDFPKDDTDRSGSGIGIENLQRRLSLLYPGKHTYCASHENGKYNSLLEITYE